MRLTTDQGTLTLPMSYQAMDARHAADVPADGPLVDLLWAGRTLEIGDTAGRHPTRTLSLQGSRKAIDALLGSCERE